MQDAPAFTSAALLRRREVLPKQQHRQVSVCPASMTALIAPAMGASRTALVATAATGRVGVQLKVACDVVLWLCSIGANTGARSCGDR